MKTSSTSCSPPQCPWPFSVVVSPSQAQVLEVESREAGGGAKQGKKKHLDVGVLDCPGSSFSLLETSTCSEPRSPETKKPKLSQVPVASLLVLDHDHDTGSFQVPSSPGSKEEKEIGKRNEEVESEPEKNRAVFDEDFEPEEEKEDLASAPVEEAAEVS